MKNYILWGRKKEEPEYFETVLMECETENELNYEKIQFENAGYITRTMIYNPLEKPDFKNVFNI